MQNPRLASRYAKSLLDLAVEKNSLEDTLKDMQLLDSVCTASSDFQGMLRSPVINGDKKISIINAVLQDKLHTITKAFVNLLVNKGREAVLAEIAAAFIDQYKALKNIKTVKLTTATPVADNVKNNIVSKITRDLGNASVDIETAVDPELIGGFVLEMEDKLFDASVLRQLKDFKASVLDNSYVSQLR